MSSFKHPALELLAQGQLAEAAAAARQGLIEHPGHPELAACFAEAVANTDPTEARVAVGAALSARPNDPALLLAAARVQWRTGDYKAAASTADRVTALTPEWAEGQATAALINLDLSQRGLRTSPAPDIHERAKNASARAVASAPDWPMAHVVDGQVELADGNHERATAAAKAALGLDESNPRALVLLGDAMRAGGVELGADRIYRQAGSGPPAADRLQDSTRPGCLRPNLMLGAMFGLLLVGTMLRISGRPELGGFVSFLGLVAAALVVVGLAWSFRQRQTTAREELAQLLTPGSELVGAA